MTKKELIEMLKNFDDNEAIVIAKPYYDPWSGHHDGDTTYEIKEIKKDKEENDYESFKPYLKKVIDFSRELIISVWFPFKKSAILTNCSLYSA